LKCWSWGDRNGYRTFGWRIGGHSWRGDRREGNRVGWGGMPVPWGWTGPVTTRNDVTTEISEPLPHRQLLNDLPNLIGN
jgi:hypothetical protein